jgi:hypothetical protein
MKQDDGKHASLGVMYSIVQMEKNVFSEFHWYYKTENACRNIAN